MMETSRKGHSIIVIVIAHAEATPQVIDILGDSELRGHFGFHVLDFSFLGEPHARL